MECGRETGREARDANARSSRCSSSARERSTAELYIAAPANERCAVLRGGRLNLSWRMASWCGWGTSGRKYLVFLRAWKKHAHHLFIPSCFFFHSFDILLCFRLPILKKTLHFLWKKETFISKILSTWWVMGNVLIKQNALIHSNIVIKSAFVITVHVIKVSPSAQQQTRVLY